MVVWPGSLDVATDGICCVVVGTGCNNVGHVPHSNAAGWWWTLANISLTVCDDGQQYEFGTDVDCGGDGLLHAVVFVFNDEYGYDE